MIVMLYFCDSLGCVLPYLGMVGRFHGDDWKLLRFFIQLGVPFMAHLDHIDLLFQKKYSLPADIKNIDTT